jgi:transcriptional repressor NrdR
MDMECPFCRKQLTIVTNTRHTKGKSQTWRRRQCTYCNEIFTTYELVDLSYLVVVKKSGVTEVFSRVKLFAGIYSAMAGSKIEGKEKLVDKITKEIEKEILHMKKKKIVSIDIGELTLQNLMKYDMETFIRFLARFKQIKSSGQLKKELKNYL